MTSGPIATPGQIKTVKRIRGILTVMAGYGGINRQQV